MLFSVPAQQIGNQGEAIMARGEGHLGIVTYSKLATLFGCSHRTVRRWVQIGRLDPSNLLDIIDKYNNPDQLDHRKKQ